MLIVLLELVFFVTIIFLGHIESVIINIIMLLQNARVFINVCSANAPQ
jgi:hypothetical protein